MYRVIYSDDKYLALLVLYPENRGHFIVIPKDHFSQISEVPNQGELFELVLRLAEKNIPLLKAKAFVLKMNNNIYKLDPNPLHIGHVHVHIVPQYEPASGGKAPDLVDKEVLLKVAELLKS